MFESLSIYHFAKPYREGWTVDWDSGRGTSKYLIIAIYRAWKNHKNYGGE